GTALVKNIHPFRLLNVNGTLFFAGQDQSGLAVSKLWKSDGTTAGTVLVKNVELGTPDNAAFTEFSNVNGTLFFASGESHELWKSDGTTAGTVLVKNISGLF